LPSFAYNPTIIICNARRSDIRRGAVFGGEDVTASVYVSGVLFHMDKLYSYRVPPALEGEIRAGMRVRVPFGSGNRQRLAIVYSVGHDDEKGLKPISAVADGEFVLDGDALELAAFVSRRCFCTFYEAASLMLEPGSSRRCIERVYFDLPSAADVPDIKEGTPLWDMAAFLEENGMSALRSELDEAFENSSSLISRLVQRGAAHIETTFSPGREDKRVKTVSLAVTPQDAARYAQEKKNRKKQAAVIDMLTEHGDMTAAEVCYMAGVSESVINTLAKAGIVVLGSMKQERDPYASLKEGGLDVKDIVLDGEQRAALDAISKSCAERRAGCTLLWGVTGSGKTMVFMHLIDRVLKMGRGAMLLVPEISLTPRMVELFCRAFGSEVAVLHSAMSMGERLDSWKRIASGRAHIVIGTRLSVFAPLKNIGLIIMDEEQESTYKSERNPRYHAREAAKKRCVQNGAQLVLASATPLVESMFAAENGRYDICRLNNRYGGARLPEVEIVSMSEELRAGNRSIYSRAMISRIEETLDGGHQAIVFLNRRGHSTFVSCRECGYVARCPKCDVPLTYHSDNGRLMCHYCGYSAPGIRKCPDCGSRYVKFVGSGTQRAQDELQRLIPRAKILRMDGDSTSLRFSHEQILDAFSRREGDVLLGTQMVVKGLDFDNVTFVGVLNADAMLYGSDFRAGESAFSMLTQVVGRAGRGAFGGRAMIQTYSPENPIILNAAAQDYAAFYKSEIEIRRKMVYPPFCEMYMITVTSLLEQDARNGAQEAAKRLCAMLGVDAGRARIIGPAPAPIFRLNGRCRFRLIVKCSPGSAQRRAMGEFLAACSADRVMRGVTVTIDTNPYQFI